jgi:hypothetical protein
MTWLALVLSLCELPHARQVDVSDGPGLARALATALPGDLIHLAPGVYRGKFKAAASGTAAAPIRVCGPRAAVLSVGSLTTGYGLHITGSHWEIRGLTVAEAKKGVVLDGAHGVVLDGIEVRDIGNEGVRFRAFSSDNVLRGSYIHHTGRTGDPHTGEGVYVGSFNGQWCEHSGCLPDRSDRNVIEGNIIGPETTAESIDVKEGTTGGVIRDNVFDGRGMVAPEGADSWVDVKGNGYLIQGNRGSAAPREGFQGHEKVAGWGRGNRVVGNVDADEGAGSRAGGRDRVGPRGRPHGVGKGHDP